MYVFCCNKDLYSATLSFTMVIGWLTVARWFYKKRFCPSYPLFECSLGTESVVFSKFWHDTENPKQFVHERSTFFEKNFFRLKYCKNGTNLGQKLFYNEKLHYLLWFCTKSIFGKNLVPKIWIKMLSPNQIAVFIK